MDNLQLRSHWSDDSSDEDTHDDDDEQEEEDATSSPLSPTFLNAWRNRFATKTSPTAHRHSRSFPPPLDLVSPRTRPRLLTKRSSRDVERRLDEEISLQQVLQDGPVATVRPRSWSHRITRRQAAEDVAWQFREWPGFVSGA